MKTLVLSCLLGLALSTSAAPLARRTIDAVLPPEVKALVPRVDPEDKTQTAYIAYSDANRKTICGYAVPGVSTRGYRTKSFDGVIRLLVGLTPDRKVISYEVLEARQTKGLGDRLGERAFVDQFTGKSGMKVTVRKDGGDIDAISGATITSRAVCDAIADACRRIDRIEGKGSAKAENSAAQEGKLLFNPADGREALSVLPKQTVKTVRLGQGRFPAFKGVDAFGKTTGYAVVGTGTGKGPNGKFVLHYLFGVRPNRMPLFSPAPRRVNDPAIDMTDMEDAQRLAFNAALQDALKNLRTILH